MADAPGAPDPSARRLDLDPLAAEGAAELRRRVRSADVQRIPRADLDGHVGLSSRTLHELGVTIAPIGLRGVPSAVAGRIQVLAGVLLAGAFLGFALAAGLEGLFGLIGGPLKNDQRDDPAAGAALGVLFALVGWVGLSVVRRGVRRVRAGRAARRLVAGAGSDPADDPQARATVAVVREPHALRVSLLWLRGDAADPELVEVRTVAEERVPADDPGRAEDAVERFSEVVLRADAARGLPAPAVADESGAARAGRSALVAVAGTELPAVDPTVAIPDGWDPEALTDDGRAELAARLVRARTRLWNPAELERLAVDPSRPLDHRPTPWPSDDARRAALAPALPKGRGRCLVGATWTAAGFALVFAGSLDKASPSEVDGRRIAAAVALAIAVVLYATLRTARRRAPGRRLLRAVRRAARTQPAALERGVPGGAGRVLVLHGVRHDDVDRLELVHVRPAPDDGEKQRLQVRTLAWWERRPGTVLEARDVGLDLWRIADDAGFATERLDADAGGVERLNRALGRATERTRAVRVVDEPIHWGTWAFGGVFAILALGTAISDDPLNRGGGLALAIVTWPLVTAALFRRSARRMLDPVDPD